MRLELYYHDDLLLLDANSGFDPLKIWTLLERLQNEQGVPFQIIDASRLTKDELNEAYMHAIVASVWNRFRIRKVFGTNKSSGCFFGKGVPALIVWNADRPVDVYPHESGDYTITVRDYLESVLGGSSTGSKLGREMDDARRELGPVNVSTSQLIREGRRR